MMRFVLSAGILAAMIGVADAAPKCSPGKIYRVSKKICVDKIAAAREGVVSPRHKKLSASVAKKSARLTAIENRKAQRAEARHSQIRRAQVREPEVASADETGSARRETTEASTTQSSQQTSQQTSQPRTIILPPISNVIGSPGSPFGAIVDQWSSDSFSALPETRFSLRTSVED